MPENEQKNLVNNESLTDCVRGLSIKKGLVYCYKTALNEVQYRVIEIMNRILESLVEIRGVQRTMTVINKNRTTT